MSSEKLETHHQDDLKSSGLSNETITAAEIYSATGPQVKKIIGFDAGPGLAFPYPGIDCVRIKPDTPWVPDKHHKGDNAKKVKPGKYLTRKGAGNHLYFPPGVEQAFNKPNLPLYITEGEKKALKATQEGLNCIGLAGVWNWKAKNGGKESLPIPDLDLIEWDGRKVVIVFDSDIVAKEPVQKAELALAEELKGRGAEVWAIRLPEDENE